MDQGFFFIFVGTMKLTPAANEEVHAQMKQNFREAAKVFPFQSITGFKPKPDLFRTVIGAIEVVCGAILILIPGRLKGIADLLLLSVMVGAGYTHYAQHDPLEKMIPAGVAAFLLIIRHVLGYNSYVVVEVEKTPGPTTKVASKKTN